MGKMEYLDALKRAMMGLPPEIQARTLAYYEQRFVDGVAAGRTEEEVGRELDDPKKIAMTLRASSHLDALGEKKKPVNVVRLLFSAVGLAIFNLFMVIPAAVFGALLASLYACAVAFYLAGVVTSASGLAGANEFVFNEPLRHMQAGDDGVRSGDATITIGHRGINIHTNASGNDSPAASDEHSQGEHVIREHDASGRIHIFTDMDAHSRGTQIAVGVGLVLGGIALFLMALVITRYTFIGIKRYLQMNLSLLRGS
jgi:uncharacterized membrane protein